MIKQGEIYWADLNPVIGHEKNGKRPVLILQNNLLNESLNTVAVAPITTNLAAKNFLTTFYLANKTSGLKVDSLALLFQIKTIDKKRLSRKAGQLKNFLDVRNRLALIF